MSKPFRMSHTRWAKRVRICKEAQISWVKATGIKRPRNYFRVLMVTEGFHFAWYRKEEN